MKQLFICFFSAMIYCGTTASVKSDSCQGRCGPGHDSTKPCQCNPSCVNFGDCCYDYQQVCVATCSGRCGAALDNTKPCQCNAACLTYGDCCSDYQSLCTAGTGTTCDTLTTVTEYFWNNDVNRLSSSQYVINWGSQVADGNSVDSSPNRLFTSVNEAALNSKPTIAAFVSLLDNHDVFIGTSEFQTSAERTEVDSFYNLVRATAIFNNLYEYLLCNGKVTSEADFKSKFYNLWFDFYPRSSSNTGLLDSSGFEHAMVGEVRVSGTTKTVSGFHSWIQFYLEERVGRINYYGYVRRVNPTVVGANFSWRPSQSSKDAVKAMGSFFVGTSPEFDLALYTLCAHEFPGSICNVQLGGASYRIQTYDINHKAGLQIGSAYPAI